MAFKIVKNPTFIHKVPVLVPVDGGHEEQSLKVQFRVVAQDELMEHNLATAAGTETYCRAIVAEFADVTDENGEPMAMSDEVRDHLFRTPFVQIALIRSYTAAMAKAKAGN